MSDKMDTIKELKDKMIEVVESQICGDLSYVDAKELGEAVDIIKDFSEIMYYCSIVDSMEDSSDDEKDYYVGKYIPEFRKYNDVEKRRDMDKAYSRMYYEEPSDYISDPHMDGKSYMSRRMFMESKDKTGKEERMREMERYLHDLADDINEMIENLDSGEKSNVKTTLASLAAKIS